MNNNATPLESLIDNIEDYGKTSIELLKLKSVDKAADVFSSLLSRIVIIVVVALFFLILNVGVALWLGDLTGKSYYGFFIVAGFYALIALVLLALRNKHIKTPIRNYFIDHLLK